MREAIPKRFAFEAATWPTCDPGPTNAGKSVRLGMVVGRKALRVRCLWLAGGFGVAVLGGAVGCSRLPASPKKISDFSGGQACEVVLAYNQITCV